MAMVTDKGTGTGTAAVVLAVTVTEDSRDLPTYDNNVAGRGWYGSRGDAAVGAELTAVEKVAAWGQQQ